MRTIRTLALLPVVAVLLWLAFVTIPGNKCEQAAQMLNLNYSFSPAAVCAFLFWLIVSLMAICFLYATWGLACGYSKKAWNDYESSQNEALRQGAIKECKRQGIDPPAFLYKDNSKTKGK